MTEVQASDDDSIARYLFSSQNYSSNGVKPNAFMDKRNPGELSVFVKTGLSEEKIWQLASEVRSDKAVKARGDLTVQNVNAVSVEQGTKLEVLIDGVPHPLHANIKFPPLQESIRRVMAVELANKSTLVIAD